MKIQYVLINFGKTFAGEQISPGDLIKNVVVNDVLEEICILDNLGIPDLEAE